MKIEREQLRGNSLLAVRAVLMAAIIFVPAHAFKTHVPPGQIAAKNISAADPRGETAAPFRIGETVNYDVAWAAFSSAATIQLSIPERRQIFGSGAWHFRASAHTLAPFRSLLTVDDQIDSYADIATLESRQYEMHLDEMGQKQNQVLHFFVPGQPRRTGLPAVAAPPGTLDPLGALYMLRRVDWWQTPEVRAPVYDGEDIVEIRAHLEVADEIVAVNAGNFSITRISVREYHRGAEVKQESLSICFANDAYHTPILLQAEIPLGSVRVELSSKPH